MSSRGPSVALLLGFALLGCGDEPELRWRLQFHPSTVERPSGVVVTRVLDGGCTGEVLAQWEIARDAPLGQRLDVGEGRIALWARAADAACVWYARGCVELDLPLRDDREVVLVLYEEPVEPRCADAACEDGRCLVDAGPS